MKKLSLILLAVLISIGINAQIQTVGIGSAPNDGTGDNLRTAFQKVNNNSTYLKTLTDTLYNLHQTYINVVDFGATGDGQTDDYAAILAAVEYAADKDMEIIVPSGHYLINGQIEVDYTTSFKMRGIGDVKFDYSGYPPPSLNSDYFYVSFDTIALGALLSDASEGDRYIDVATGSLSINDYFYLRDTLDYIEGYIDKGEVVQVKEIVSGTQVEIYEPLFDSYTAASTSCYKTSEGRSYLKNIQFIAPTLYNPSANRVRFLDFRNFNNLTIEDVIVNNAVYQNLSINFSRNVTINNYRTTRSLRTGFGYGLVIGASQDITVTNSMFKGVRHGFTTGGYFPARAITLSNNIFGSANGWPYCFDTHPGAEHITLQNNILYGGVQMRSPNTKILDNHIIMDDSAATTGVFYSIQHGPVNSDYSIIKGNTIERITESVGGLGVNVHFQKNNDTIQELIIADNIIKNVSYGINISSETDSTSNKIEGLRIRDNYITCNGNGYPLVISGEVNVGKLEVDGGSYTNASGANYSAYFICRNIDDLSIRNTTMLSSTSNIYLNPDDVTNAVISENDFKLYSSVTNGSILLRNMERGIVHDNYFYNTGKSIDVRDSDTAYIYNNNYDLQGDSIYSTGVEMYYQPRNAKMNVDMITDFVPFDQSGDSLYLRRDPNVHLPFLDTDIPAGDTLVLRIYFNYPDAGTRWTAACEIYSHFHRASGNTSYHAFNKLNVLFYRYTSTIEGLTIDNEQVSNATIPYPSISSTSYDDFNYVDVEIKNEDSVDLNWNGVISNFYNMTAVSWYLK
jgi:hypothetical protein